MTPIGVALWAAVASAPPAASPPAPQPQPATVAASERARLFIDSGAPQARRGRLIRSSLDLSFGAVQVVAGTYALVRLWDRGSGVQRHAVKEVVAGGAAIIVGSVFLGLTSQMEKLRQDREYLRVIEDPGDRAALVALERRWQRRAKTARVLRLVSGGVTLAAGTGLATWGIVSVALRDLDREDGGTLWGLATTTGGAFLMVGGRSRSGLEVAGRGLLECLRRGGCSDRARSRLRLAGAGAGLRRRLDVRTVLSLTPATVRLVEEGRDPLDHRGGAGREEHVEGVLRSGDLGEQRRLIDTSRSFSTNGWASCRGDIVSRSPWMTKNGGAASVTRSTGE